MKTTDLKTSKELADALEKAGYDICPRYSFEFIHTGNKKYPVLSVETLEYMSQDSYIYELENPNPAFTMWELWDMLPKFINNLGWIDLHDNTTMNDKGVGSPVVRAGYKYLDIKFMFVRGKDELESLANLVMWCIEKGHELNLRKK